MADVILAVLNRPETAATLLDAAWHLAALLEDARINVLAVREPVYISGLAAEALIEEANAVLEARRHEREHLATLRAAFDRWVGAMRGAAAAAHWVEAEGSAATVVGARGSRADVIVAEQPSEHDRLAGQVFKAALFGTGRPVLMVPPGTIKMLGRRVAIAWRDEKRAVSALIPALRCLAEAEEVHVLMGVREGAERPGVPRILAEHGVRAELHVLPLRPGPFGQVLMETVHFLSADMLVMGAYAHSPLRELILGGVTRYVVARADVPVLMRH